LANYPEGFFQQKRHWRFCLRASFGIRGRFGINDKKAEGKNMEGVTVPIGGRMIPLKFGMDQFAEIEETVGYLGDVKELMEGKNRVRNTISVIRILGNGGLKAAGEQPDLTEEWLRENMEPQNIMIYQLAAIACRSRAEESEAVKEENENTERDLVLEEINKKKEPANSHTGG
jgi:hypothetical protein